MVNNMNRKTILLLLILISICAISHVSAQDEMDLIAGDNITDIQSIEQTIDNDACQVSDDEKLDAGNNDYRNIQKEIDNAQDGDTIDLEGEYVCDYLIVVNKSVKITGKGEGATIKYNGSKNTESPFFHVKANNVTLNNVNFIGGTFYWGGAITWQGDNAKIINCKFTDNVATGDLGIGGAVLLMGDNCNITKCIFTNNRADLYGGALLCNGTGGIISNCEFRENVVTGKESHGGAVVFRGNNYIIDDCIFIDNHAFFSGGAVSALNENNIIKNSNFTGNYVKATSDEDKVYGGGAILSLSNNNLTIDNCNFTGNYVNGGNGGAVFLSRNDTLKNSYFKANNASIGNDVCDGLNIFKNTFVIDYDETREQAVAVIEDIAKSVINNNTFIKIKINSSVEFYTGMVFQYGATGSITVKVTGGSLALSNITVLNHPEAKITFNGNLLTVSNLAVGSYTLRATTTPDENHTSVSGDLSITVNKATAVIQASAITVALKSGSSWAVKIVDSRNNNPISGMKINLNVYTGGKYQNVQLTTNSNGEAYYNTRSLAAGDHKIVVSGTHPGFFLNTFISSIKVVKQTALKFKLYKKNDDKGGSLRTYIVMNKKTKKGINGIKLKVLIYSGKKYKTFILKTKKIKDKKGTHKGVMGFSTNQFSAGKHKVVIMPADIKYKGSVTTSIKITKSATKRPKFFRQI